MTTCPKLLYLTVCLMVSAVLNVSAADLPFNGQQTSDSLLRQLDGLTPRRMLDLADSCRVNGEEATALSIYLTAARVGGVDDSRVAVKAYTAAGDMLMRRCDYAGALANYTDALMVSENDDGHPATAILYKNIGNVYCCIYDYETGIDYYNKGLELCREHPAPAVEKKLLINLAGMYTYTGNVAAADSCRRLAFSPGYGTPSDEDRFLELLVDGLISRAAKKYEPALMQLRRAAAEASSSGIEPRYECSAYHELYTTFNEINQTDSALLYMRRCESMAQRHDITRMFPSLFKSLAEHYAAAGDSGKANEYRVKYFDLRESILDERDFNSVNNVLFKYKASATAEEINDLRAEQSKKERVIKVQKLVLWGIAAGLLLVIVFSLLFYRQKQKILRNYRSLYEINREHARMTLEMEERHRADLKIIRQRDTEITDLRGKNRDMTEGAHHITEVAQDSDGSLDKSASGCVTPDSPSAGTTADSDSSRCKYSSSNLDIKRRSKLAEAILEIMENKDAEFCAPDFSLETLARMVDSNVKYVSQTINEEFNRNFSTFVNEYRIRIACDRFADPEYDSYKIKYIGESVGFRSQTAFSDAFRRHTGLSPSVYKKMAIGQRFGN